jgi:hypothetical protein
VLNFFLSFDFQTFQPANVQTVLTLLSSIRPQPPYYPLQVTTFQFERKSAMKKLAYLFLAVLMIGTAVIAKDNPLVGGEPVLPTKDIVANAVNSAAHTTLVAAVKAAGLVETAGGAGLVIQQDRAGPCPDRVGAWGCSFSHVFKRDVETCRTRVSSLFPLIPRQH